MEENKTKKTGANGLILTVLLIAAIIIAFMEHKKSSMDELNMPIAL